MASNGDGDRDPVGTKSYRVTKAIHWHFTTDRTWEDIAEELGVSVTTAKKYVREPPADEVRAMLKHQATSVRIAALEELKRQLREAGSRSRSAEKPIKIWPEEGEVRFTDVVNDRGEILERIPIPDGFEIGPDEEQRFYGRSEARDILEMMINLVGAAEPDKIELSGELGMNHSGHDGGQLTIGFEPTALEEIDGDGAEEGEE